METNSGMDMTNNSCGAQVIGVPLSIGPSSLVITARVLLIVAPSQQPREEESWPLPPLPRILGIGTRAVPRPVVAGIFSVGAAPRESDRRMDMTVDPGRIFVDIIDPRPSQELGATWPDSNRAVRWTVEGAMEGVTEGTMGGGSGIVYPVFLHQHTRMVTPRRSEGGETVVDTSAETAGAAAGAAVGAAARVPVAVAAAAVTAGAKDGKRRRRRRRRDAGAGGGGASDSAGGGRGGGERRRRLFLIFVAHRAIHTGGGNGEADGDGKPETVALL